MAKIRDPLNNLFEKLLSTKYPEVHLWNKGDLRNIISKNEPAWWDLLKWLLGELDDGIKDMFSSVERDELPVRIKEVLLGLGLCSSNAVNNLALGKVNVVERINLLTRITEIMEVETRRHADGRNSIDYDYKRLDDLNFKSIDIEDLKPPKGKQNVSQLSSKSLMHVLNNKGLTENTVALEEKVLKKRQELGLTDENITASEYKGQLLEKKESIMERLVTVVASVKDISQTVSELNKSELQALLPVEMPELIEVPGLEELSEKVACFSKFLENQDAAKKSLTHLHKKFFRVCDTEWSVKNTDSLKLNNLLEQVNSVIRNKEIYLSKIDICGPVEHN